jgi:hypothetical protein
MAALRQEIEYPGGRYQITGRMGMSEWFEWCIKNNFHSGFSLTTIGIMKIPSTKYQISNKSQ